MSRVTVTTVDGRGFCSETDCGIEMFLVFGRISVSAECTSRYTTRIISMSIIGISVSGPWPPPALPWRAWRALAGADHVGASPSAICGNSSRRTTLPPSVLWRTRTASITCTMVS